MQNQTYPFSTPTSSERSNTRSDRTKRHCGELVKDVVVQGVAILQRTSLRPVLEKLGSFLVVDFANRRGRESCITVELGQYIGINVWLGELLSIRRCRDERNRTRPVKDRSHYIRHVHEMTIMGRLEQSVQVESELILLALIYPKTRRCYLKLVGVRLLFDFGLDFLQAAQNVNGRLDLFRIFRRRVLEE